MDLEKSNRWIVGGVERLKELTRNLEAAEQVTKEMQEAATAKLSELYQREAEVAEELVQSQSESHDLRDRCVQLESARRDAKLALKAVCLQVDSPGVYCLSSSVDVTEGLARGSPKCERLATDTVVHVVEVVHRLQERRVRGRIESPAGWISLLDIDEGSRWADKQLDASNEWIAQIPSAGSIAAGGLEERHQLSSTQELVQLRARCSAVEAHRDSLLSELDQLQDATRSPIEDADADGKGGRSMVSSPSSSELQLLRARCLLMEAERSELDLEAELQKTRLEALEADHMELSKKSEDIMARHEALTQLQDGASDEVVAARGLATQNQELRRQVDRHATERGIMEGEAARLRAEKAALSSECRDLLMQLQDAAPALEANASAAASDLAAAEQWVLYGAVPKLEDSSSQAYLSGRVRVDFESAELTSLLAPLAAVNGSQRSAVIAAVERGDILRSALQAFRFRNKDNFGFLELEDGGISSFLTDTFKKHGLTPPLEPHLLGVYRFFDPRCSRGRLDAHECVSLADALVRAVLCAGGPWRPVPSDVRSSMPSASEVRSSATSGGQQSPIGSFVAGGSFIVRAPGRPGSALEARLAAAERAAEEAVQQAGRSGIETRPLALPQQAYPSPLPSSAASSARAVSPSPASSRRLFPTMAAPCAQAVQVPVTSSQQQLPQQQLPQQQLPQQPPRQQEQLPQQPSRPQQQSANQPARSQQQLPQQFEQQQQQQQQQQHLSYQQRQQQQQQQQQHMRQPQEAQPSNQQMQPQQLNHQLQPQLQHQGPKKLDPSRVRGLQAAPAEPAAQQSLSSPVRRAAAPSMALPKRQMQIYEFSG
ncbi:unnamed protein product [Polarella glacialis]|uniref:Uncharacterized protein n=1 Tax=Polarella glacialis TaxID=89957 RepID=A0A813GZ52_POLGL|nr:unnamed protein product [Polarella glacialis]